MSIKFITKKKKEIEQYVQSVGENNLYLIKKVHENLKAIRIVAKENNGANQDKESIQVAREAL